MALRSSLAPMLPLPRSPKVHMGVPVQASADPPATCSANLSFACQRDDALFPVAAPPDDPAIPSFQHLATSEMLTKAGILQNYSVV